MQAVTSDAFRVGVQHRLFHLGLRAWRQERGVTQRQLSQMAGLSPQRVTALEAFRAFPSVDEASTLADVTGIPAERLFPTWLREWVTGDAKVTTTEHEITESMLGSGDRLALTAPSGDIEAVECEVDRALLGERLEHIMDGALTPRERRVLRLRFGLEDGQKRTLEEIGHQFGVTRNRIRQIEAQALRKVRHPKRTVDIRPFLDYEQETRRHQQPPDAPAFQKWLSRRLDEGVADPYVGALIRMIVKSSKVCEGCRTWSVSGLRNHIEQEHGLSDGLATVFDRLAAEFKGALRKGQGKEAV